MDLMLDKYEALALKAKVRSLATIACLTTNQRMITDSLNDVLHYIDCKTEQDLDEFRAPVQEERIL